MNYPILIISFALIGVLFLFSSCKTYYIPIESFKEQFMEIDSEALVRVRTRGPAGDVSEYLANPIRDIYCVDKKGNHTVLKNGPSIEIRFTKENNKRTIFYFDRVFLEDSIIYGDGSRFINFKNSIPIDDIKLIEVQDGRKRFKYVD